MEPLRALVIDLLSQGSLCTSRQLPMSRSQTAIVYTMHLRSVVRHTRSWFPSLYARHIRSRGVATDRSPVTTNCVVAYVLCSKNVVRVNEAKLRTEVSCTKDILSPTWFSTDPHRLLLHLFYLRSRFSHSRSLQIFRRKWPSHFHVPMHARRISKIGE